jgi:hypothetical protein
MEFGGYRMIEADIIRYLKTVPSLSGIWTSMYPIQAPKGVPMPYMIIETVAGDNKRTGQKKEEKGMFRISLDCGPSHVATGRDYMERAWEALDEYRGALLDSNDIYIECGVVRGWAGLGETYRYMFDGSYRSMRPLNSPT